MLACVSAEQTLLKRRIAVLLPKKLYLDLRRLREM